AELGEIEAVAAGGASHDTVRCDSILHLLTADGTAMLTTGVDWRARLRVRARRGRDTTADRLAFHHPEQARIRALFAFFDQINQPSASQIEFLEKAVADYSSLDRLISLVPERLVLRNFATSLWEFAHAVDRLQSYPWNISLPVADICNAR